MRVNHVRPTVGALLLATSSSAAPLAAQDTRPPPEGLTGTVIVLNKRGNDASFVDLASGRIVGTAPTGAGPHELAVSSDGRVAVGTDYGGGDATLSVFDVVSGRRVGTIDLGRYNRPHGIGFLPGDSLVAVTSQSTGHVVVVHVARGEVVEALATEAEGSHMLAVTADGETIWTGDMGSNTVTELSRSTGGKVRSFAAPGVPEAVNVTPFGTRVFAGSHNGRVTAFLTSDGSTVTVAEDFAWPYRVVLTPGVRQIVIPDAGNEVVRFFDGTSYRELGRVDFPGQGPQGVALHPDGRHLFLSLSRAGRIAVIDVSRREVVGHLPAGAGPDGIGYSPLTVHR